jgi:hypothetical protein
MSPPPQLGVLGNRVTEVACLAGAQSANKGPTGMRALGTVSPRTRARGGAFSSVAGLRVLAGIMSADIHSSPQQE